MARQTMPGDELQSSLEVQPGLPPDPTWTQATGSNGAAYSYRYDTGTGKKGRLKVKAKSGLATFEVDLDAKVSQTFAFGGVVFNDPTQQLWLDIKQSSDRKLFIKDLNQNVMSAYYAVIVVENEAVTIQCDPMIKNDP